MVVHALGVERAVIMMRHVRNCSRSDLARCLKIKEVKSLTVIMRTGLRECLQN